MKEGENSCSKVKSYRSHWFEDVDRDEKECLVRKMYESEVENQRG